MSYAIKELFYTLQGEGLHAGTAAVFMRFAGCNLWSGRAADRAKGKGGCALWCDTDFVGTDGENGARFDSPIALATKAASVWDANIAPENIGKARYVVCTGGEPLLQLDAALIEALHNERFFIAVETNGTIPAPEGIDHLCLSPKAGGDVVITSAHAIKLVYPQPEPAMDPERFDNDAFGQRFLQPLDNIAKQKNTRACVEYCLKHPQWRLSLQTHKLLGIP